MQGKRIGVIGNGSWGTALVKIITDNGHAVNWWMRNTTTIEYIQRRHHNPNYLHSASFDVSRLYMSNDVQKIVDDSDVLVIAVPSAYAEDVLQSINKESLKEKKILSAIKGLIPGQDILLNQYLEQEFGLPLQNYFAVLGPCHAEEVAAEKLSYLTFSGIDGEAAEDIAACFRTPYINTVVNTDILGVQYAAVMKNIYALGAGIAHGLDYGDNFLSVFIANSADEMAGFLRKAGVQHIVVGEHETLDSKKDMNYAASVYLGDLLVTCYSPYSRNRTFGTMIGKGYTVKSAQLELNMVAEGYYASRCMHNYNKSIGAEMPIADTVYKILWERMQPKKGFEKVEEVLV
jgi:glycerol-3-phosphate dehydrogenase (NAD(P)+)